MIKYLYISLCCFLIAIIAFLFMGCAVTQSQKGDTSVLAVIVAGKDYPTRVKIGYISEDHKKRGVAHAQAEYFDGTWKPLQVINWPKIVEGVAEYDMLDVHYRTGKGHVEKYKGFLK